MREIFKPILKDFTLHGSFDEVGLWQVIDKVRHELSIDKQDQEKIREAVLEFVEIMLNNGFIAVNLADHGGYEAWPDQNPAHVAAQLQKEWKELDGREPEVGLLVWFHKV